MTDIETLGDRVLAETPSTPPSLERLSTLNTARRRRRRRFAAAITTVVAVAAGAAVFEPRGRNGTVVNAAEPSSAGCPRAVPSPPGVPITIITGESVHPTFLPPGFVRTRGDENDPVSVTIVYANPAQPTLGSQLTVRLSHQPPMPGAASFPHTDMTVRGHAAMIFAQPGNQNGDVTIDWQAAPTTSVSVSGHRLDLEIVKRFADGIVYNPGATTEGPAPPNLGAVIPLSQVTAKFHADATAITAKLMLYGELEAIAFTRQPDGTSPTGIGQELSGHRERAVWVLYTTDQTRAMLAGPPVSDDGWAVAVVWADGPDAGKQLLGTTGSRALPNYLAHLPDHSPTTPGACQ
jgi:hypothetical protein